VTGATLDAEVPGTGSDDAALPASALVLQTEPAPRESTATFVVVPTTITNSGTGIVPISLDNFYARLDSGVLVQAWGADFVVRCSPHFMLLPGGSIRCDLEFLANTDTASELRYIDGTTLPATTVVTERRLVAGCIAVQIGNSCFTNHTESAFSSLSGQCASDFRDCRDACLGDYFGLDLLSDCTCDAECLELEPCAAVDAVIRSTLTSCGSS